MHMSLKGRRTLAVAIALLLGLSLLGFSSSQASAANRCGTIFAGKFVNRTNLSIKVTGDTKSSGVRTRWIPAGGTAAGSGICDADYFWTPAQTHYESWTGNYLIKQYSRGTKLKIGSNTDYCEYRWFKGSRYMYCKT